MCGDGESWGEDLLMSRVAETEDDLTEEPSIIWRSNAMCNQVPPIGTTYV